MGALCGPYLLGSTIDLVWGMKDENGCKQAWTGCRWIHVDAKDASIQEPPMIPTTPPRLSMQEQYLSVPITFEHKGTNRYE